MFRVSEVLNYFAPPYLVKWKLKVGVAEATRISNDALVVGTIVDEYVRDFISYGEEKNTGSFWPEVAKVPVKNCIMAWNNFIEDHPEFFKKAQKFKHNMQKELKLGDLVGHPDFIFDDELPDLKTSKSINKSHWMQVAQYAKMNNCHTKAPQYGPYITKISILRLDKYDPKGVYEYKVLEEPFITFWQSKFQCRYDAYIEDTQYHQMMRKVKERQRLA